MCWMLVSEKIYLFLHSRDTGNLINIFETGMLRWEVKELYFLSSVKIVKENVKERHKASKY